MVFTLLLTGLIGGGITYYYQNRAHRDQQELQEVETARQSALVFLRDDQAGGPALAVIDRRDSSRGFLSESFPQPHALL